MILEQAEKRVTGTASGDKFTVDVNTETLNTLVETLQELVQRLAPLAGAVASNIVKWLYCLQSTAVVLRRLRLF